MSVSVCVCVCARVRACVCVCVCVQVSLPNTCWQYVQDLDASVAVEEQAVAENSPKICLFEGTRYHVGDSWLPDVNATCYTCSCMVSEGLACVREGVGEGGGGVAVRAVIL